MVERAVDLCKWVLFKLFLLAVVLNVAIMTHVYTTAFFESLRMRPIVQEEVAEMQVHVLHDVLSKGPHCQALKLSEKVSQSEAVFDLNKDTCLAKSAALMPWASLTSMDNSFTDLPVSLPEDRLFVQFKFRELDKNTGKFEKGFRLLAEVPILCFQHQDDVTLTFQVFPDTLLNWKPWLLYSRQVVFLVADVVRVQASGTNTTEEKQFWFVLLEMGKKTQKYFPQEADDPVASRIGLFLFRCLCFIIPARLFFGLPPLHLRRMVVHLVQELLEPQILL